MTKDRKLIDAWERAFFSKDRSLEHLSFKEDMTNEFKDKENAFIKREDIERAMVEPAPGTENEWLTIIIDGAEFRVKVGKNRKDLQIKLDSITDEKRQKTIAQQVKRYRKSMKGFHLGQAEDFNPARTKVPEIYTPNHSLPLNLPSLQYGAVCVECKRDYPHAIKELNFVCWGCKNGA